ncbi:MAG: DUF3048 domain-containing protein [Lachnospiraceae bacterium]|nr:DUF3048 domain-containing protein [Lachnospiraceae bacterium]
MRRLTKKTMAMGMTIIMGLSLALSGCGKEELPEVSVPSTEAMNSAADIELINTEGKVVSDLTGEWVDPAVNNRRPVAIMINNIGEAMPQSGIGQADVMYEMIVEGGITRLMAVFSDYSGLEKIGPVRSARQYYVRTADHMDAIFCHIGTSTLADSELASSGADHMDGMGGIGNYFIYRDNSRVAPHNAYTSEEGLNEALEVSGFNMEHGLGYEPMFSFNSKNKDIEGGSPANKITTAFSAYRAPWFEYNAEDKLYYRFQYGEAQIDDVTGEQLRYQNVLVLYAETYSVDGYLMEVCNEGSGEGYYASNGQYIPITWKYASETLHFYDANGNDLMMNPGKTWVTFFDTANKSGVTFE